MTPWPAWFGQSESARIAAPMLALHNMSMLNVHELKAQDLHGLSPSSLAEVAAQMLQHIGQQSSRIDWQSKQLAERDRAIKFKDAKLERITFELARLKAWKFAARTEASLQAQLEALQAQAATPTPVPVEPRRQPKRQALPEHLVRVEHHLPAGRLRPADGARGRGRE